MATTKKAKKMTPKKRKPSKTELLSEAEDLLKRIEDTRQELETATFEHHSRKESAKRQKEVCGEIGSRLRDLELARKEKHPLFDAAQTPAASANGDWQSLPIAELNLPKRQAKAIVDAGFSTLGQLQSQMNDQGIWWAKQIKDLGDGGAEKVSDAFVEFWKKNPQYAELPANEPFEDQPLLGAEKNESQSA